MSPQILKSSRFTQPTSYALLYLEALFKNAGILLNTITTHLLISVKSHKNAWDHYIYNLITPASASSLLRTCLRLFAVVPGDYMALARAAEARLAGAMRRPGQGSVRHHTAEPRMQDLQYLHTHGNVGSEHLISLFNLPTLA